MEKGQGRISFPSVCYVESDSVGRDGDRRDQVEDTTFVREGCSSSLDQHISRECVKKSLNYSEVSSWQLMWQ